MTSRVECGAVEVEETCRLVFTINGTEGKVTFGNKKIQKISERGTGKVLNHHECSA